MTGDGISLNWKPPGPVAAGFMAAPQGVVAIQGPIGGGKTIACFMKLVRKATEQQPSTLDGVRKFKFCVVRDTYRQLWKTTIPSWHKWVPKTVGEWSGGHNEPANHRILFDYLGERIDLTVQFVAIGDNKAEDVLRGYEVTAFYLNEADLLDEDVFTYARGRVGRYPDMKEGGPTWKGIVLDFNAPEVDSWIYDKFIDNRPEGFAYFNQPSGLSPQAENLANLPAGYYAGQMEGQPAWYIDRMIKNKFGYSREGKPIYPEFNDQLHVASGDLAPAKGLPLVIGLDAGGTPAGVILQRMPNGQWRILDELVVKGDGVVGPSRFAEKLNQLLRETYEGWKATAWADPSAAYGADVDDDELNWIQIVESKTKIRTRAAPTNAPSVRWDAVRNPLQRMIDGHHPGLLLSPTCKMLRKGFNATYRFRKRQGPGNQYDDKADKNDASHPHDALQYAMLGGGEYAEVKGRAKSRSRSRRQRFAITEDDPRGTGIGGRQRYAVVDD